MLLTLTNYGCRGALQDIEENKSFMYILLEYVLRGFFGFIKFMDPKHRPKNEVEEPVRIEIIAETFG